MSENQIDFKFEAAELARFEYSPEKAVSGLNYFLGLLRLCFGSTTHDVDEVTFKQKSNAAGLMILILSNFGPAIFFSFVEDFSSSLAIQLGIIIFLIAHMVVSWKFAIDITELDLPYVCFLKYFIFVNFITYPLMYPEVFKNAKELYQEEQDKPKAADSDEEDADSPKIQSDDIKNVIDLDKDSEQVAPVDITQKLDSPIEDEQIL